MMARTVVAYTGARIFAAVLNVLALAVFTRLMNPSAYGFYLLIASQAYIAHAFTSHWLLSAFFSQFQVDARGQLATFATVTAGILIAVGAGAGILVMVSAIAPATGLAFISIVAGFTVFEAGLTLARSAFWIARASVAVILRAILYLAFGAGALSASPDAATLAVAFGAANLVASIPVLIAALSHLNGAPNRAALRGFVGFGWPLILSSGVNIAGQYVDRLLVGYFLGVAALGSYGAVSDLVRQSFVLMGEAVSVSLISGAKKSATAGDARESRRLLRFSSVALTVIVVFGVASFAVFGSAVISVLLGPEYRDADIALLAVLALGSGILMFRVFYLAQMIFFGRPAMLDLISSAVLLTTTVVAGLALVPVAGAMGAAIAIVLGQVAGSFSYALANQGSLPWDAAAAALVIGMAAFSVAASEVVAAQSWSAWHIVSVQALVFTLCFLAVSWFTNLIGLREALSRRQAE